ncbi:hypothetical protein M8818_006816 [Zalaria obscura]|uniref:Uncharacterized protein n=1 Tax=Zalaria obscura TaxID=2024903 RepID=A0ACC3S5R3_9PEZI
MFEEIYDYLVQNTINHPFQAFFNLFNVTLFFSPFSIFQPFLAAIGFGRLGPIAASCAAWFQSSFGTPLPFRVFQSAAMGGYGTACINAVSRGFSGAFTGGGAVLNGFWGMMTGNGTAAG